MGAEMLQSANHHVVDLRFVSPSQKREEEEKIEPFLYSNYIIKFLLTNKQINNNDLYDLKITHQDGDSSGREVVLSCIANYYFISGNCNFFS